MKKFKQLICGVLVFAMLVVLMSACGSSPAEETAAPAPEQQESTPAPEPENDDADQGEEEPVDNLAISLPLTEGGEEYSYFVSYPDIMSNFFDQPFFDYPAWVELENRTGVHIEWVMASVMAETEIFYVMLNSGDYTDMFSTNLLQNSVDFYVEEDIVRDIKDAVQEYMPNYLHNIELYPELAESIGSESDSGYWCVLHNYTKNNTTQGGLVIRQDWLDELNLELPETLEEYHNALTLFKTELGADSALWINHDGILNSDAFSSAFGITSWVNNAGMLQYPFYQVDGVVKYGHAEDGFRQYLEMMAQWYAEGLVYQDFYSYTRSSTNAPSEIITNGDCGVYTSQAANIHEYDDMIEGYNVVGALTPVMNKGDAVHIDWSESGVSLNGLCVSTAVADDELPLLLKMWDYCCSEEGGMLLNYGIEGETYEIVDGKPMFTETVTNSPMPAFTLALNAYTLGMSGVGVIDRTRELSVYSEKQLEALDRWFRNVDGAYNLPDLMTLTTEETEQFNARFTDVLTYVNTFTLGIITGNEKMSDDVWNNYLSTLDDLEAGVCTELYQAAYDRYMAKKK